MSLYALFTSRGPSGFGYASTAEDVTEGLSLAGKTMRVTGCNSGLGHETLRVLALRGARVVATARTLEKARAACEGVTGDTLPLACELSDPASVRACVETVKSERLKLDAIICNAGVMALPRRELAHGVELQFFTNHVGHFMLVTGLLDQLTEKARVVMGSSSAHRNAPRGGVRFDDLDATKQYGPWRNYGQSKFANILFAKELARRVAGTQRTANAVHPGVINTNLSRHMPAVGRAGYSVFGAIAFKNVAQGAATQVYVATHPAVANVSGQFFVDCNVARPRSDAEDAATATKLWEVTEQLVASLPTRAHAA